MAQAIRGLTDLAHDIENTTTEAWNWKDYVMITAVALSVISAIACFFATAWIAAASFTVLSITCIIGAIYVRKYSTLLQLPDAIKIMNEENVHYQTLNVKMGHKIKDLEEQVDTLASVSDGLKERLTTSIELQREIGATQSKLEAIQKKYAETSKQLHRETQTLSSETRHLAVVREQMQKLMAQLLNISGTIAKQLAAPQVVQVRALLQSIKIGTLVLQDSNEVTRALQRTGRGPYTVTSLHEENIWAKSMPTNLSRGSRLRLLGNPIT